MQYHIHSVSVQYVYLEKYGPLVPGDVNAVGLSVGHVPMIYINVVGLPGAAQVVPNL